MSKILHVGHLRGRKSPKLRGKVGWNASAGDAEAPCALGSQSFVVDSHVPSGLQQRFPVVGDADFTSESIDLAVLVDQCGEDAGACGVI